VNVAKAHPDYAKAESPVEKVSTKTKTEKARDRSPTGEEQAEREKNNNQIWNFKTQRWILNTPANRAKIQKLFEERDREYAKKYEKK